MKRLLRALVAALSLAASLALGVPPTNAELEEICAQADDATHCGRLVEAMQMKRLPNLARRDGNVLSISLFPSGTATFSDSDDVVSGRSYSLWDYLDGVNAVLLYTTAGEKASFTLLTRANNRRYELPTEPQLSPDRQWLVTADVCQRQCTKEIAVWRVTRENLRKELLWNAGGWADATAKWKDAETLAIEYSVDGATAAGTIERKLSDPSWKRLQ
ncbi:MAG: hypothetical protein M3R31_07080 [Pseudomonadota bacterium]|nr:hypothetical protein [Pseudomonadota bacterium]